MDANRPYPRTLVPKPRVRFLDPGTSNANARVLRQENNISTPNLALRSKPLQPSSPPKSNNVVPSGAAIQHARGNKVPAAVKRQNSFEGLAKSSINNSPGEEVKSKALRQLLKEDVPDWTEFMTYDLNGGLIGTGGYGSVYHAKWINLPKNAPRMEGLVVKVFRYMQSEITPRTEEEKKRCAKRLKELQRELTVWSLIKHDHIVPFKGVLYQDNDKLRPSLVSSYMKNGGVLDFIKKYPGMEIRKLMMTQFSKGLRYMHHEHKPTILHGDLSPDNILVDSQGNLRISDFGLARMLDGNKIPVTSTSHARGKTRYKAPELLNAAVGSLEGDVYAYASICMEIITGQSPWKDCRSDSNIILAILDPNRKPALRPEEGNEYIYMSDYLWKAWSLCWATDPQARPTILDCYYRVLRSLVESDRPGKTLKACVGEPYVSNSDNLPKWRISEGQLYLPGTENDDGGVWQVKKASVQGKESINLALKLPLVSFKPGEGDEIYRLCGRWFNMKHECIMPLLGVMFKRDCSVDFGSHLALVCPWGENLTHQFNGNKGSKGFQRGNVILSVADALCYMHSFKPKLVHGRLNPGNIRIVSGQAMIDGLGYHKLLLDAQKSRMSKMDLLCIAPELKRKETPNPISPDFQNGMPDVYSFAMTSFFILTWGELDPQSLGMDDVTNRPKKRKYSAVSENSPLWGLWAKCWRTSPEMRISMKEAREEFLGILVDHWER